MAKRLSSETIEARLRTLEDCHGNYNDAEKALGMSKGSLRVWTALHREYLPRVQAARTAHKIRLTVRKRSTLEYTLQKYAGSVSAVARSLGVHPTAIYLQIKRLDLVDLARELRAKSPGIHSVNARVIEFDGERKTLTQWAKELGITREALRRRLDVSNWPLDRALRVGRQTLKVG